MYLDYIRNLYKDTGFGKRTLYIYCLDDKANNYLMGEFTEVYENGRLKYIVKYYMDLIERYEHETNMKMHFLPGCSFRHPERVFYDKMPTFTYNRLIPPSRKDLPKWLDRVGLKEYDKFEYIRRTYGVTLTDPFFFHESPDAFDFKETIWHYKALGKMDKYMDKYGIKPI